MTPTFVARFLARRVPWNGCLLWTGGINGDGYGYVWDPRVKKVVGAHRIAYEIAKGPIPPGFDVDHTCFRTDCVDGDHLEAVPAEQNRWRWKKSRNLQRRIAGDLSREAV